VRLLAIERMRSMHAHSDLLELQTVHLGDELDSAVVSALTHVAPHQDGLPSPPSPAQLTHAVAPPASTTQSWALPTQELMPEQPTTY